MDDRQFDRLMDRLQRISAHLEELKIEAREHREAEKRFWSDLVNEVSAIGL